jgi:exodeoxyribonuclease V gamma subunit
MRSIPCRVICLLGMNDAAFPRRTTTLSFDLIAQHPRRGDRSQPIDDRYLFLEAIISAREKLYISYVGQSIQDNSEIPPSVVVSELLDYLEQGYKVPNRKLSDFLVVKQRLQAFSPRYFEPGSSLYSYSQEQCRASQALLAERRVPDIFIKEPIVQPEAEQQIMGLQDLISYFDNPAKYLLNRAIGLYLDASEAVLEDREPFILNGLDKYQIEQQLAEHAIKGKDERASGAVAAAAGMLPHGSVGEATLQLLLPEVRAFSETVRSYIRGQCCPSAEIACRCAGYSITGIIKDFWPDAFIRYRCATVKAKDRLRIWIQHLILNAAGSASIPRKSILIGTDYVFETEALEDRATGYLRTLIEIYQRGRRGLVHFFPESSLKYVEALQKGKSQLDALEAARIVWEGNDYASGERNEPYFALCFTDVDPFTEEFEDLARQIYEPLLQHQIRVR